MTDPKYSQRLLDLCEEKLLCARTRDLDRLEQIDRQIDILMERQKKEDVCPK